MKFEIRNRHCLCYQVLSEQYSGACTSLPTEQPDSSLQVSSYVDYSVFHPSIQTLLELSLFFLQKSFSFLNLIPSSSPQSGYQADDEFSLGSVGDPSNHSTAEVSKGSWPSIATSGQARAARTCLPKTKKLL